MIVSKMNDEEPAVNEKTLIKHNSNVGIRRTSLLIPIIVKEPDDSHKLAHTLALGGILEEEEKREEPEYSSSSQGSVSQSSVSRS